MKLKKPECAHCGSTEREVELYWSSRNLLKKPIKTYYCHRCIQSVFPRPEKVKLDA